ncbi:hypothetical protein Hanom_Chr04g00307201 [Helianthus anomalus]
MANILLVPPGENMPPETAVNDNMPPGEWVADGGSDWKKDTGDDGGAIKGRTLGGC